MTGSPAYFPLDDNSPALGAGHITYCTAADQRGESRPQPVDSNCDIGAFEHLTLPLPPTGTPTATNTPTSTPTATYTASATLTLQPTLMPGGPIYVNADCPLPAAVTSANTDSSSHDLDCVPGSGDDEIILPSGGGTTTLTGTLNISSNITITGNGHIISGGGTVRVISIGTSSGRLTLNNVTIENGWATGGSSFGGAIRITAGALTVNNSTFKNNRAVSNSAGARGGAVYAAIAITIRNSTFSGNSATNDTDTGTGTGGAIALYHGGTTPSELIHLTVAGGNTADSGAGVYTHGSARFNLRNSIIANNNGTEDLNCQSDTDLTVTASLVETQTSECPAATLTGDPVLGSLTGSPAYFPLGDTSPAIGAGDSMYCTAADQIGNTRPDPAGSSCDIGAIESARGMPLATETPTSTPAATNTASATYTASPTASATRVRVDIMVDADCPLPAAVISANTDSNTHDSDCDCGLWATIRSSCPRAGRRRSARP